MKLMNILDNLFKKLLDADLSNELEIEELMPWSSTILERIKKRKKRFTHDL